MRNTIIFAVLLTVALAGCKSEKYICNSSKFKNIYLHPVNTILRVPEFIYTDTMRYGDASNVLDYKLRSLDSSLVIFAGVKSYYTDQEIMPDLEMRMVSEKEQVISGQDSMILATEFSRIVGKEKVGYLKYFDSKRKRFEARIFFNKGYNFVDIWLFEKQNGHELHEKTAIDCILENIEIK